MELAFRPFGPGVRFGDMNLGNFCTRDTTDVVTCGKPKPRGRYLAKQIWILAESS